MPPVRVGFVSSEIAPFAKSGGLADVAAALPRYLHRSGHDVRLFMPRYASVDLSRVEWHAVEFVRDVPIRFGDRDIRFSLITTRLPGTDLWMYLVDCPEMYDRGSLYPEDGDEHLRFATLCRAAIESFQRMGWAPDIVHCNDWHAALLPLYLKTTYAWDALFARTRTVLTIHNIAYQGYAPASAVPDLGLADHVAMLHQDDLLAGFVNCLKTGILHADVVTTVSATYAREIRTEAYGHGLEGVLRGRGDHLVGIVNGVDYGEWSPETDPYVPHRFSVDDLSGKALARAELLRALALEIDVDVPLAGVVSRLNAQKGFDLFPEGLTPYLAGGRLGLAALGSGDERYERFLGHLQTRFPGRVCFYRGFNERLAHLIEAGADLFLMPSRFEPCGLNQMYSLRYGTVPVVRSTGGLADTVEPWNAATGEGTGFVFDHFTPTGLRWALAAALDTWRDRDAWARLMRNGMLRDFSWDVQGARYVALYRTLMAA